MKRCISIMVMSLLLSGCSLYNLNVKMNNDGTQTVKVHRFGCKGYLPDIYVSNDGYSVWQYCFESETGYNQIWKAGPTTDEDRKIYKTASSGVPVAFNGYEKIVMGYCGTESQEGHLNAIYCGEYSKTGYRFKLWQNRMDNYLEYSVLSDEQLTQKRISEEERLRAERIKEEERLRAERIKEEERLRAERIKEEERLRTEEIKRERETKEKQALISRLRSMRRYIGKLPDNGFLKEPHVNESLSKLLEKDTKLLLDGLGVQESIKLDQENDDLVISGCKTKECSSQSAIFTLNLNDGKVSAAISLNGGEKVIFYNETKNAKDLPRSLKEWIKKQINRAAEARKQKCNALSQDLFYAQMKDYKSAYDRAPNEIKKSAIFNQTRMYEKQYFDGCENIITNWRGYLTTIGTNKGGSSLRLIVRIGQGNLFQYQISFREGFGMFDGIVPSSNIYRLASEFKEGDCVIFSGKVDTSENSLTESGAMRSPSHDIHFTSLTRCTN